MAHYEQLRRQAVGNGETAEPTVGWAVLVRRGMAHWMQVCGEFVPGRRADGPNRPDTPSAWPAPNLVSEIVTVWAGMVLNHLWESSDANGRTWEGDRQSPAARRVPVHPAVHGATGL